jgi:sulfoquinovose isomerase
VIAEDPLPEGTRSRLVESCLQAAKHSRTEQGFGWILDDGSVDSTRVEELWINARMTHVLALAVAGGDERWLELADHGFQALRKLFYDSSHGGWLPQARMTPGWSKRLYDHAFVLLAACSLKAIDQSGSVGLLEEALETLDRRFWVPADGAALDARSRDWTEIEPYRGANGNMHLVEALLAASDVTGERAWAWRALLVADRIINTEARRHSWRVPEHFDSDWRLVQDYNQDVPADAFRPYGLTPGHGLEWARLLLHLEVALGAEAPAWLVEAAVLLAERALLDAWRKPAGLVYTTDWVGQPVVAERFHWVACEAVLATQALWRRTGSEPWRLRHDLMLRYTLEHHVTEDGGWLHELDAPTLTVSKGTWQGRPDVYHAYQMLVLPTLPMRASAIGGVLASREERDVDVDLGPRDRHDGR